MLRVAVAGVPDAWSTERLCAALRDEGVDAFVFALADCVHDLNSGTVTLGERNLAELDGIIVKKLGPSTTPSNRLRLHILSALQDQHVRIFSPPSSIARAMDRYGMHVELARAGLPVPPTYAFDGAESLRRVVQTLGASVLKPVYTSKGRGMSRVSCSEDAVGGLNGHDGPVLLQQFVQSPGRDIGACVLGGEFVGAFYRVADAGNWMTTTASGGTYAPCVLDREGIALAERAAAVFGLDYTVADLVETSSGYRLYEVSAFGGFRGLWQASQMDVAAAYAQYVCRKVRE